MDELEQRVLARSKSYAESKGFSLNQDEKILAAVISALAKNEEEKGKLYCPCRALTGNEEEDQKNVCPCAFHLKEIEEDNHCRCQLFFRKACKK